MEREDARKLLRRVRSGKLSVDAALDELRSEPIEALGHAILDLQRALRRGFPEVVYGPGKTVAQILDVVGRLSRARQTVLVTRVARDVFEEIERHHPKALYHEAARMVTLRRRPVRRPQSGIAVISAGTSDIPVAEEAAVTAEIMDQAVERIYDVGVAGLHRLLAHKRALLRSRVLVVVAGMEGALPSVVAGLTDCPVIGVPTSVGYGAGAGGHAALLAMLNSCATGLTVVNIDNGFGAGYAAAMINRRSRSGKSRRSF